MKFGLIFIIAVVLCSGLSGNNILISNSSLTGQNTNAGHNNPANYIQVQFTVSWENSWRMSSGPANWDAAWVFVKYRLSGGDWQHAWLNNNGHFQPSGCVVDPGLLTPGSAFNNTINPAVGAFIYRSSNGTGTFMASNVQLRWNYGAQGVSDSATVEVKVFAVEMVYVPQGAFNAGGGAGVYSFTPTTINTSNATMAPSGTGSLGGQAGGYPSGQTAPSGSGWPNGYTAYYCMKYEISQQEYVDFLNTLTRTQQSARVGEPITGTFISFRYALAYSFTTDTRNGIACDNVLPPPPQPVTFYCDYNGNGIGGESDDGQGIACNWICWADLAAYFDWSGLRPMTELEYEKVCRGNIPAVPGEFAWGSNASLNGPAGISNAGQPGETASNPGANTSAKYYLLGGVQGPMRVGCFAKAGSSRIASGAAYYGAMEMSGNVRERIITINNVQGRSFTGLHGNGNLAASGEADVANWPAVSAEGTGMRGGDWLNGEQNMWISDRGDSDFVSQYRDNLFGGRGVRTAP